MLSTLAASTGTEMPRLVVSAPASVVLSDPDAYARRDLRRILGALPDFAVLAEEAATVAETRALCDRVHPALLVLAPPTGDPIVPLLGELSTHSPETRVVILALVEESDLPLALNLVQGYVLKEEPPTVLIEAMRTVVRGGMGYSRIALDLLARERQAAPHLDEREWRLLRCLMTGMEDRDIAPLFGQSVGSIRNDLSRLYALLGVHNRLQAAVWGWRQRAASWHKGASAIQ